MDSAEDFNEHASDYPLLQVSSSWPGEQTELLMIIPKIPATLSLLGSICIIMEVLADHREKNGSVHQRLLLGMSSADVFFSLSWALTTWPSPKEDTIMPFAIGNTQTCTFQGTILQFGNVATPMYNAAIAFCYMLRIRYNWSDSRLRVIEPWIHTFILTVAATTSLMGIPLRLYNNTFFVCWISDYPVGCRQSYTLGPGEESNCIRGDNATLYVMAFLNVWLWSSFAVIIFSMHSMYAYVKSAERASIYYRRQSLIRPVLKEKRADAEASSPQRLIRRQRWVGEKEIWSRMTKTRKLLSQALWYTLAYFFTEIPDSICTTLYYNFRYSSFWLLLITYLLNPAQGFVNFMVFTRLRPQPLHYRASRLLESILFWRQCRSMRISCFDFDVESEVNKVSQTNEELNGDLDQTADISDIDIHLEFSSKEFAPQNSD